MYEWSGCFKYRYAHPRGPSDQYDFDVNPTHHFMMSDLWPILQYLSLVGYMYGSYFFFSQVNECYHDWDQPVTHPIPSPREVSLSMTSLSHLSIPQNTKVSVNCHQNVNTASLNCPVLEQERMAIEICNLSTKTWCKHIIRFQISHMRCVEF